MTCKTDASTLQKVMYRASKNLQENEKHFKYVVFKAVNDNQASLNQDSFADITFDHFVGREIKKINTKAFGSASSKIKGFLCQDCEIENSPPDFDVWKALSSMSLLEDVNIGLNASEIPSNAIVPTDGKQSQMQSLTIKSKQNLTIRSNAFHNMKHLYEIKFDHTKFAKFEKEAFKFSEQSGLLSLEFYNSSIKADSFENGTFDGINRRKVVFTFSRKTNVTNLPRSSFNSVLDQHKNNTIRFFTNSTVNCEDCNNLWLSRENKTKQILTPACSSNKKGVYLTLFSVDIQNKLRAKCNADD